MTTHSDRVTDKDVFDATIEIVCAYISNPNSDLRPDDIPNFVRSTFSALAKMPENSDDSLPPAADLIKSKAEIRKSIGLEHITSFIDGREYKSLKRHLTRNNSNPERYRQTFGLPPEYPMTHPAYSARRSALAKSFGLGLKRGKRGPK